VVNQLQPHLNYITILIFVHYFNKICYTFIVWFDYIDEWLQLISFATEPLYDYLFLGTIKKLISYSNSGWYWTTDCHAFSFLKWSFFFWKSWQMLLKKMSFHLTFFFPTSTSIILLLGNIRKGAFFCGDINYNFEFWTIDDELVLFLLFK
jgi:hypothetical protein